MNTKTFCFYLTLLFFLYSASTIAQKMIDMDNYETEIKPSLHRACLEGIKYIDKEILGVKIEINPADYCDCVTQNLAANVDINDTMDDITSNTFLQEQNEKCLLDNSNFFTQFSEALNNAESKRRSIQFCQKTIKLRTDLPPDKKEEICTCLFEKAYDPQNLTSVKSVNKFEDYLKEISESCIAMAYELDFEIDNNYNPTDITGYPEKTEISLSKYGPNVYKISLKIRNELVYFTLDTGAVDSTVSTELAHRLKERNAIRNNDFVGISSYVVADGREVEADIVNLDYIVIGDYKVDNVKIAIVENGMELLGMSFLNKFKKWEIDSERNKLILYK